jgi:hypothetical protein
VPPRLACVSNRSLRCCFQHEEYTKDQSGGFLAALRGSSKYHPKVHLSGLRSHAAIVRMISLAFILPYGALSLLNVAGASVLLVPLRWACTTMLLAPWYAPRLLATQLTAATERTGLARGVLISCCAIAWLVVWQALVWLGLFDWRMCVWVTASTVARRGLRRLRPEVVDVMDCWRAACVVPLIADALLGRSSGWFSSAVSTLARIAVCEAAQCLRAAHERFTRARQQAPAALASAAHQGLLDKQSVCRYAFTFMALGWCVGAPLGLDAPGQLWQESVVVAAGIIAPMVAQPGGQPLVRGGTVFRSLTLDDVVGCMSQLGPLALVLGVILSQMPRAIAPPALFAAAYLVPRYFGAPLALPSPRSLGGTWPIVTGLLSLLPSTGTRMTQLLQALQSEAGAVVRGVGALAALSLLAFAYARETARSTVQLPAPPATGTALRAATLGLYWPLAFVALMLCWPWVACSWAQQAPMAVSLLSFEVLRWLAAGRDAGVLSPAALYACVGTVYLLLLRPAHAFLAYAAVGIVAAPAVKAAASFLEAPPATTAVPMAQGVPDRFTPGSDIVHGVADLSALLPQRTVDHALRSLRPLAALASRVQAAYQLVGAGVADIVRELLAGTPAAEWLNRTRGAMAARARTPAPESAGMQHAQTAPAPPLDDCSICMSEPAVERLHEGHACCTGCLAQHARACIADGTTARLPVQCPLCQGSTERPVAISQALLARVLSPAELTRLDRAIVSSAVQLVHCPGCGTPFERPQLPAALAAPSPASAAGAASGAMPLQPPRRVLVRCPDRECRIPFCATCGDRVCTCAARASAAAAAATDSVVHAMAKREGWRACLCGAIVEKVGGCNHMKHAPCPAAQRAGRAGGMSHFCYCCGTELDSGGRHEVAGTPAGSVGTGASHFPNGLFSPCNVRPAECTSSAASGAAAPWRRHGPAAGANRCVVQ